jgi:hypothetical protein
MVEANWARKNEILKALAEPESRMPEIAGRFNISRGTVYHTLNEFTNVFRLTEEENDFPRKLLRYFSINLPEDAEPLNESDIRSLRHFVEKAKKKEMMEDEMDSIPSDYNNTNTNNGNDNSYRAQTIGMSQSHTVGGQERFDTTTEEGLLRSILYKAKNVNPGAIERFIELYDLSKKHFSANPQALQQLMMHIFGPAFGSDAFTIFMNTRGQYVSDTVQPSGGGYGGGGGMNPMMMAMMMSMANGGGQNMAQMLPLLMQSGGSMGGGNGGQMGDMMGMMMMTQMNKAAEKQAQQEKFDQMMNMMMLRMIGGTMDSRNASDISSGNFMVQEILDKDKNVKERQLVPMSTVLSNPMMMGGMFKQPQDETTQMVLKNALDEKSKAWEIMASANQPLNQILMTLLGNFQSKNDPIAQFGQLMEIRDKYMGGGGQVDPEIEKMKIDLQLATQQQNFQLEQMKHQWDMEREEKKAGAENVKSWMSMIGQVGEKLAAPAMAMVAGSMGKGGMMSPGAGPSPAGLPPLGAGPQPVKPGDITRPQPQTQGLSPEGIQFGTPDPDHSGSGLFPDSMYPQQSRQQEMDPQVMMMMAKQQEQAQALTQAQAEIHRLRSVIVQEQHTAKHQQQPAFSKDQLTKMSTDKLQEIKESLQDNERSTEQLRMALEAELSDREWLSSTPELEAFDREEANKIAKKNQEEEEQVDPEVIKATEQEEVDELPEEEPTQGEIDEVIEQEPEPEPQPNPEFTNKKAGRKSKTS